MIRSNFTQTQALTVTVKIVIEQLPNKKGTGVYNVPIQVLKTTVMLHKRGD